MAYGAPAFVDFKAGLTSPLLSGELDVTPLANGGFALIGTRNGHINAGIYDSTGALVRPINDIPGIQGAVAQLSGGDLVIASVNAGNLSFTIIDPETGGSVVATTPVAVTSGRQPDVTALEGGGFALSYEYRFSPGDTDLYMDIYNSGGLLQTTVILDSTVANAAKLSIATLDDHNIAAAWTLTDNDTGQTAIFYAVYSPDGFTEVVSPRQVTSADPDINRNPSISATDGGFAIAFETRVSPSTPSSVDIALKTYNFDGVEQTSKFITNGFFLEFGVDDESDDSDPVLQRAPDGNLVVSYTTENFGTQIDVVKNGASIANTVAGGTGGVATFFGIGQVAVFSLDGGTAEGRHYFGNRDGSGNNANDTAVGDDFLDIMNGGGGNDTLSGARNDDQVKGDAGNDVLHGNEGDDFVTGGGDTGNDVGADTLFGDEGDDGLSGEGGNDTIEGGTGNDNIDGGTGADLMRGGDGRDAYWIDNAGDVVDETTGRGKDTVFTTIALDLASAQFQGGVENATALEGAGSLILVGNARKNVLTANSSGSQLNGAGGNDTMIGGNGNDYYFVDSAKDKIVETGLSSHDDRVFSSVNRTLGANLEVLTLTEQAVIGNGNDLNNAITGNTRNNTLRGRDGADTLAGGAGNDTLIGGSQGDVFRFAAVNAGADRIEDFNKNADRFQLPGGGSFTNANVVGADTILTHGGGTVRIAGVNNLTLAQWNALVIPGGESGGGLPPLGHFDSAAAQNVVIYLPDGDWIFA